MKTKGTFDSWRAHADTFIPGLNQWQAHRVYSLLRRAYQAGRRHQRDWDTANTQLQEVTPE